jgi:small-conductance mechanosensitive channel
MNWWTPLLDKLESLARTSLRMLPLLGVALVLFLVVYLVAKLVRRLVQRASARLGRHRNVGLVLGRLAQSVLVFLGLLVAVTVVFPSFRVANLVQLLGITSVAVGFAFRDILQNFLAGILLLWTQPFQVGDQILYDNVEGTVEDIQTRATFVRTYDGRRIVIPNSQLFTNSVTVNTAYPHRRVEYDVGIGADSDVGRAKTVILGSLAGVPDVLKTPAPDVLVFELADFSVKLRVRWWIKPPRQNDALGSRDAVLAAVRARLLASGFELPYPTTEVLLHDRARQRESPRLGASRTP